MSVKCAVRVNGQRANGIAGGAMFCRNWCTRSDVLEALCRCCVILFSIVKILRFWDTVILQKSFYVIEISCFTNILPIEDFDPANTVF